MNDDRFQSANDSSQRPQLLVGNETNGSHSHTAGHATLDGDQALLPFSTFDVRQQVTTKARGDITSLSRSTPYTRQLEQQHRRSISNPITAAYRSMSPFLNNQYQLQPQQQLHSQPQPQQQQHDIMHSPLLTTIATPILPQYPTANTPPPAIPNMSDTPPSLPRVSTPTLPKPSTPDYFQFQNYGSDNQASFTTTNASTANSVLAGYSDKFLQSLLLQDDLFTMPSNTTGTTSTSTSSSHANASIMPTESRTMSDSTFSFLRDLVANHDLTSTGQASLTGSNNASSSSSYNGQISQDQADRRRSINSIVGGDPEDNERQERGRRVHREAERQRRISLRTGFEQLKELLPASTIGNYKSWSHTRLLESGLEYIEQLQEEIKVREKENRKLKDALRKVLIAHQEGLKESGGGGESGGRLQ